MMLQKLYLCRFIADLAILILTFLINLSEMCIFLYEPFWIILSRIKLLLSSPVLRCRHVILVGSFVNVHTLRWLLILLFLVRCYMVRPVTKMNCVVRVRSSTLPCSLWWSVVSVGEGLLKVDLSFPINKLHYTYFKELTYTHYDKCF